MSVRIIIDSTADIIPEIKDRFITVPLMVNFGDEEYIDGVTINHKEFYEKLISSEIMPQTSQATPVAFEKVFKEVTDAGDTAVVITLASKLSGTYQSAIIAADDYVDKIFVVDSKSATMGSGVLAQHALNLADKGMSAKEIAEEITVLSEKVLVIAVVDTLEYLKRGGRISKAVAFAGRLLSIKPIINIEDGEIKVIGKARGLKQANSLLLSEIENAGGIDTDKPLLLGYTGLKDEPLQSFIDDNKDFWNKYTDDIKYTVVGSVVGTHAGPGAYAVAFIKK